MISLEEARRIVLEKSNSPSRTETIELSESFSSVLAQELFADADAPPFDRAMMDGFAVHAQDLARSENLQLRVVGESRAGKPFTGKINPGETISILTGAEVPVGANAVLPLEKVKALEPGVVQCLSVLKPGQHIARQGEDVKAGELLLGKGTWIRPQEIAVLAATGKARVEVFAKPRVSVLPTGDELVGVDQKPARGQIRESNSFCLQAQLRRMGINAQRFSPAPDDPAKLQSAIEQALENNDCLLLSGGVSVGVYDYVASALEKLGAIRHFHGVKLKPGKPVWFGSLEEKKIFGLPGNPVSSFVIFELLVRPCLEKMLGLPKLHGAQRAKFLGGKVVQNARLQAIPAMLREGQDGWGIKALAWSSSGDFYELTRANALMLVPPETVPANESVVEFFPI